MNPKILLTTGILTFVIQHFSAQNIEYTYDNAGNRYQRKIIYLQKYEQNYGKMDTSDLKTLFTKIVDQDINIYPNPFNQSINILIKKETIEKVRYEIYQSNGVLMMKDVCFDKNFSINLSHLHDGEFILRIEADNYINEYKIVKQN
ncbi:MAG TPA: T9SS type A sorting domain-containing protein [Bacteroidales bacterium]|nr:T9SS type A sorting domain-containing protein [Bacteroidales bacterium]